MINRFCTCSLTTIVHLIRRVSDNHVKFHAPNLLRSGGVNELIGVGRESLPFHFAILGFRRAAIDTSPILPAVGRILEADVALGVVEMGDGVYAVGILGTIEAAAGEQAGQLGDGDAIDLFLENVVHPFLQVGDLLLQTHQQPLGDLPQEYAALAGRVKLYLFSKGELSGKRPEKRDRQ